MYPADRCRGFSLWDLGEGYSSDLPPAPSPPPKYPGAVGPKPVFKKLGGREAGRGGDTLD